MFRHFVIMSSSYSEGKRIAIHCCGEGENVYKEYKKNIVNIKKELGDLGAVSTHYLQTEKDGWQSVVQQDRFFEGVEIKSPDTFVRCIKEDMQLNALDVAKYIQSSVTKCTHLKLEKLVYLCYADYLCSHNKQLFRDSIKVHKFGPVVDSVFTVYKGKKTLIRRGDLPAMRSRILFAHDGTEKLLSIEKTLKKYGKMTAHDLVDITHRENSPWNAVKDELYSPISDELILKLHKNES